MPIELVAYDPAWPEFFAREAARLEATLGAAALRLEHVGSTSVPGLAAKPIVDIQLSVADFAPEAAYREPLEQLGYHYRPDDEPRHRFYWLNGPDGRRRVNLHVCRAGGEWEAEVLAFRDRLRGDAFARAAYEQLKRELAPRFDGASAAEREAYAVAKAPFIRSLLGR